MYTKLLNFLVPSIPRVRKQAYGISVFTALLLTAKIASAADLNLGVGSINSTVTRESVGDSAQLTGISTTVGVRTYPTYNVNLDLGYQFFFDQASHNIIRTQTSLIGVIPVWGGPRSYTTQTNLATIRFRGKFAVEALLGFAMTNVRAYFADKDIALSGSTFDTVMGASARYPVTESTDVGVKVLTTVLSAASDAENLTTQDLGIELFLLSEIATM